MLAFRMDEKTLHTMTATDNHAKTTERVRSGIEKAPNKDLRKTIDELADHFDISHGTVYYIITNKLKMAKVSARLLSEQHKSVRIQTSKRFLESLVFHQNNARAHGAQETIMTIDFLGFERLDHSPYSPNLAPVDFAIFPKIKGDLCRRRFDG